MKRPDVVAFDVYLYLGSQLSERIHIWNMGASDGSLSIHRN